jgi:hypothetical protein
LWNEDGSCVGAATREVWGLSEVVEAEVMELSEAIDILGRFQHHEVIIELDNLSIVKVVNNRIYLGITGVRLIGVVKGS